MVKWSQEQEGIEEEQTIQAEITELEDKISKT
jgi:hypothetical protein